MSFCILAAASPTVRSLLASCGPVASMALFVFFSACRQKGLRSGAAVVHRRWWFWPFSHGPLMLLSMTTRNRGLARNGRRESLFLFEKTKRGAPILCNVCLFD
ncbi:hypothetical protein TW95_gp0238 [Pandoravirus inopinatum]|uniref:Uncharacterized protein n=1 Tax=Pandoravirus inopinatum TaxID=1605721 RepID=A0A0B5JBN2_9VIRU|nr:hypothetical protein TW95_gp0238 [Pandoravirus inopinatum]AJF96972.1 hypothetical protein [Pandoravirus inopinatum]